MDLSYQEPVTSWLSPASVSGSWHLKEQVSRPHSELNWHYTRGEESIREHQSACETFKSFHSC